MYVVQLSMSRVKKRLVEVFSLPPGNITGINSVFTHYYYYNLKRDKKEWWEGKLQSECKKQNLGLPKIGPRDCQLQPLLGKYSQKTQLIKELYVVQAYKNY